MPTLTIQIDDATAERLQALATARGTTPEREVGKAVEQWIEQADTQRDRKALLMEDAKEFMDSHAEAFRRLAS